MVSDRTDPDPDAPSREQMGPPAPGPCVVCPYRRDVPSGVWDAEQYEKLRRYDNETAEQPLGLFQCHLADAYSPGSRMCGGWAGCHGDNLLALRLAQIQRRISPQTYEAAIGYRSPTPLFGSGAEAADHGQAELADPGPEARAAIAKIEHRRTDLRTSDIDGQGDPDLETCCTSTSSTRTVRTRGAPPAA